MKPIKLLSTLVLIVALSLVGYQLFSQAGENVTFYYEVDEVYASQDYSKPIKISGIVQQGSIESNPEILMTSFVVEGENNSIPVAYTGPVPDIFKDGIQVVVRGNFDQDGIFVSDELMAKCPSKYDASGDIKDFDHLMDDASPEGKSYSY